MHQTERLHYGIILVYLLLLIIIDGSKLKAWKCKGPETEYTNRDCEIDKQKITSANCYYLQHFQQYRPCSGICNDVRFGSIDEDRCRAYCPAYLNSFCKVGDSNLQKKAPQIQKMQQLTSRTIKKPPATTVGLTVTKISETPSTMHLLIGIIIAASAVVIMLSFLCVLLMYFIKHKKKAFDSKNSENPILPTQITSIDKASLEEAKIMHPIEDEECSRKLLNKEREEKSLYLRVMMVD